MIDYYDRLETQLAQLTASGAHRRRRWAWRPVVPRMRLGVVAVAAAVALVVVVGAVLLSAGTSHEPTHQPATVRHGPPVIHNYYPGALPPPTGPLICNADLEPPGTPPGIQRRRHGMVIAWNKPPTESEFTITGAGLKPTPAGYVYAVWALPTSGGQLMKSEPPLLLGVIKPSVGSSGKLAAQGVAPANTPPYLVLALTLQPSGSLKRPGRIVLSGAATL